MENIELIKRLVQQVGKHVESLETIGARDVYVLNAAVRQLQALVNQLKERGNS